MSGIGGVWNLGGQNQVEEVLKSLAKSLARRGPDGCCFAIDGPVGMVFRPFVSSQNPSACRQPLRTGAGMMVACDGRLDARAALERSLGLEATRRASEAELIAEAYLRWGEECGGRLTGDFAVAIWDPKAPRLLLVRDPMGVRPLFYCHWRGGVFWSSTLSAILASTAISRDLNEEWVAEYFSFFRLDGHSPFRGVMAVPPGHVVSLTTNGSVAHRYWRPEAERHIVHADDDQYVQEFAALFREAVRCRLPTGQPVGADLSGGLDSSSIVCTASELLSRGEADSSALLPVSYVFNESPTTDERRFIRAVEARIGRSPYSIVQEKHPIFDSLEEPFYEVPSPLHCVKARWREAVRFLRQRGARVLLRGIGGDPLLWSEVDTPFELADLLRRGHFRELLQSIRSWGRQDRVPYTQILCQGMVVPLLPRALRVRLQHRPGAIPPWMSRRFALRMRLRDRLLDANTQRSSLLPTRREHCAMMEATAASVAWSYDPGPVSVDVAYPFLDRRLVAYCLALPFRQFVRDGVTRWILRRALESTLPQQVLHRQNKVALDEAVIRACSQQWSAIRNIFPRPRICEFGFAEERPLRECLEQARFGKSVDGVKLLNLLGLEFWLRREFPS